MEGAALAGAGQRDRPRKGGKRTKASKAQELFEEEVKRLALAPVFLPSLGRGESPLWLAQASKLAPAHALCGTILATILHLRSHRRATMSAGVSPRRRAASSLAKRDR